MSLPADIDTLKSTISKRGGMAVGNRFAIYITHPGNAMGGLINMDVSGLVSNIFNDVTNGRKVNPMSFFNDPRDMFLLCESVSIPGKRISTMEKNTRGLDTKVPYTYAVDEVSAVFHLTNDYYIKKYFDSWQAMIIDHDSMKVSYKKEYVTDITIQQLSASSDIIPPYAIKLENAYSIGVSAVELSNGGTELLKVTINFGYDNWKEMGLIDGFMDLVGKGGDLLKKTDGQIGRLF